MKKMILIVFGFLLLIAYTQAQTKPKEKTPTQKEMEEMMKEAQKELDNLSPEDKKMMEDMGIKMPSLKEVPQVGDNQLAKAYDKENQIVPNLNASRIDGLKATPLNAGNMAAYISATNSKLLSAINAESKTLGDKINAQHKSDGLNAVERGKAAIGLWILGQQELAVYVLGKVVIDDPSNTDNLCNYASMLSMTSAEQLAIPILNNLNKRFKQNSTILNNLGQAWFGLGDMAKAEKYLDSTIHIYAYHPQANLTKSLIEENKGDKVAAIEAVKNSIKHSYTNEKEDRLRKLGYKLTGKDMNWDLPRLKADLLVLSENKQPEYPKTVDACIASERIWQEFQQKCAAKSAVLEQKMGPLKDFMEQQRKSRIQADLSLVKNAVEQGKVMGDFISLPFYADKATHKLNEILHGPNGFDIQFERLANRQVANTKQAITAKVEYDKTIEDLNKAEGDQTGEGLANKSYCPQKKGASDAYLSNVNKMQEDVTKESLELLRRRLNEEIYWYQYMQWPDEFEVTKIMMEISWLNAISNANFETITLYKCESKPPLLSKGKLSEFDDVACQYHSEMKLGPMKITSDCSRMTTEIDAPFVKMGLNQNMDKKTFEEQFMNCTVEVRAEIGKEADLGPVKVGASVTGGAGIEIDRAGVKDVYLIGGAGVSAGPAGAGFEGRASLVGGSSSVGGTGMFENVN